MSNQETKKVFENIQAKHPSTIRRKQIIIAAGIVIALFAASGIWVISHSKNKQLKQIPFNIDKSKKIVISNIAKGVRAEDRWLEKAEGDVKGLDKRLGIESKSRQTLEQKIENLERIISSTEEARAQREREKEDIIDSLKEELKGMQDLLSKAQSVNINQNYPNGQMPVISRRIQSKELELEGGKSAKHTFNLAQYLPAGSYVKAVVMSGVDASVGVNSQGDPRPVLFRVIGKAKSSVKGGKSQEVDLTGCTVTGAASGDLSSERVFVRLLKMTCGRETESVTESDIEGYAAALGKAGIRGQVVSREGDFITKSFLAGITSGIGSGIAQRMSTPMAIPSGLATQRSSAKDILGSGVGKGIESSGNRLSDYLIERAEQYQPVISIPAGLDVELVFHKGIYIDGRGEKK